jgi:hypothetical protein
MSKRKFPFIPKSSVMLEPGDFWSIPLDCGLFACGRVIGHWPKNYKGSRSGFLAGLLDWSSNKPPSEKSIAGATTKEQGGLHLKTILLTGGEILGNRSLELDKIFPQFFIEYPDNREAYLYEGLRPIRPATIEEIKKYSKLNIFGFLYLKDRANFLFCNEKLNRKE